MFEQQSKAREYLHLILNIAISSLFAVVEQLMCNITGGIIWDLVFIPCGIIFSLLYITQYFQWNKGDLSSFFFWVLIIKRIFLLGINEGEFVYFLFGLLNGIYTNKLNVNDKKKYYLKFKTIIQVLVISALIIYNFIQQAKGQSTALIVVYIIISLILGINDNIDLQNQTPIQEEYQTDLKHNLTEIKKSQTTIVQLQQQQQQQQQYYYQQQQLQQKSNWEQYQQQTDEWICKMDLNKYCLLDSLNLCEQNYAMRKSLGDLKISIQQLFQNLMITSQSTNLQQSINLWSEIVEKNSLQSWLEKNFFSESSAGKLELARQKQYRYGIDGIQGMQEDQISIISPQNEGKGTFNRDQVHELSAISAIQQHGDMQGSNSILFNKTTLGCYFLTNQLKIEMSVSIFLMEDEFDTKKSILILVLRNIDKEVKRMKTSLEKTEQQKIVFYKYIKRVAEDVGQILQQIKNTKMKLDQRQKEFEKIKQSNFISLSFCDGDAFIKSEKMLGEMKLSQHLSVPNQPAGQNSNQRVTSSLSQNHETQDEQIQKLYSFSQPSDLIKQIDKWQTNVLLIEQNNFNFFELFSTIEFQTHRFNFVNSLNSVKELFKQDNCVQKYNITISFELNNENEMVLISDKRKIKQVLMNIIKNSIQSFDFNLSRRQSEKLTAMSNEQKQDIKQQELKVQNTIIIKTWADEEKIVVEVIDNGGGITQEMLKNRIQDCKLGLQACRKILKQLSHDPRKPLDIVNYVQTKDGIKGTVVQFTLSKQFVPSQSIEENVFSDSLTMNNKVELN